MKQNLFFVVTLLMSLSAFSAQETVNRNFSGRVGRLVVDAMKASGVKGTCKADTCTYTVTDFYSADETDGCGGGTTSYETSLSYGDRSKYDYKYCEGSVDDGGDKDVRRNKAQELVTVLYELDYFETSGWRSTAALSKIECYTSKKYDKGFANCVLTENKN